MNWVVTVIGLVLSTWKLEPGPKKLSLPRRRDCMSHPLRSQTLLNLSSPLPQSAPSHLVCSSTSHAWRVNAVLILLASQMSISVQQDPYLPLPAFGSVALGFQPSELACPLMNLRSCGHCASQ